MSALSFMTETTEGDSRVLRLAGAWRLAEAAHLRDAIDAFAGTRTNGWRIEASGLESLDSAGAWLLRRLCETLSESGAPVEIIGLSPAHAALYHLVVATRPEAPHIPPVPPFEHRVLIRLGKASVDAWFGLLELIAFIGRAAATLARGVAHPSRLRPAAIARHLDETGIDAIPIVGLIAFLISVVLAYQGAYQLRQFGAELFTVNLVGVSVLREMGVLLTAIMVAGRSGSAFTAEIGVMVVNDEVDAMRVIGLDPFEVLVVPRLVALMITLPLLTFLANLMGLFGGAVISMTLLDISLPQYLEQLKDATKSDDFFVGMVKAPAFAFLIGVVGCMRGMQVTGSAESVGRLTTASVVESIFLVLLADALFSILFTRLGI